MKKLIIAQTRALAHDYIRCKRDENPRDWRVITDARSAQELLRGLREPTVLVLNNHLPLAIAFELRARRATITWAEY